MTPADLAALHAACFETPRPWTVAEFESFLKDKSCFLLTDTKGFLLGRTVQDEAELLTLAVHPTARRQGIARQLLDAFQATCKTRGGAHAYLEVSAENTAAIALYMAAGWSPSGRRKAYYKAPGGTRIDALIFTTEL